MEVRERGLGMYSDRIKAALNILRGKGVIFGVKLQSVSTIHISALQSSIEDENCVYMSNSNFSLLNGVPIERDYSVALD